MKKTILSLSIMLMMVSSLFSLTSCGDDDDNVNNPVEKVTIKEVLIVMNANPTEDMLKYADLKITMTNEKGEKKNGVVDANNLKFQTTISTFPASVTIEYTCTPKEGVKPEDDAKVAASRSFVVDKYYIMSDGTKKLATASSGLIGGEVYMFGNQLNDYLLKNPILKSVTITVDENGEIK